MRRGWKQTRFPTASPRAARLQSSLVSWGKKVPGVSYSKSWRSLRSLGSIVASISLICSCENMSSRMTPPSRAGYRLSQSTCVALVRRSYIPTSSGEASPGSRASSHVASAAEPMMKLVRRGWSTGSTVELINSYSVGLKVVSPLSLDCTLKVDRNSTSLKIRKGRKD